MRSASVLLAIGCCVSAVSGQWLETTIDVPERFCGSLLKPHVAVYNPANGRVYIGGDGGSDIVVLDATTGAKAAKIPTGSAVNDACCDSARNMVYFVTSSGRLAIADGGADTVVATIVLSGEATGVCFAHQENKVYCAGWYPNIVTVVDGVTNQIVTTIPALTGERKGLCYYPPGNKVYCTSTINKTLVIDCQADTVIDTIPVGEWAHRIFYDAVDDKIYSVNFNDNNLTAIDPSADTVLATIAVHGGPMAVCYSPPHNRLFCASGGAVTMIDPAHDSVASVVYLPSEVAGRDVHYNAYSDRVYCASSMYIFPVRGAITAGTSSGPCFSDTLNGLVTVVDGATGAFIRHLVVGLSPEAISGSPHGDRVFVTNYDGNDAAMLDATSDSMLATIALNGGPRALTWAGTGNKVYCGNRYTHNVTVVDGETDSVLKSVPAGGEPYSLCYNSVNNKVYVSLEYDSFVKIVDASSDTTIAAVPTIGKPRELCYSSRNNRVYCAVATVGALGNVTVIDGESNAKLAQVTTGEGPWKVCYNPSSNKVYCANSKDNDVSVVNCSTNTVVATVPVGDVPHALCCNPEDNKVYCATPQSVAVIDGASNQVITTLSYGMSPVSGIGLCYNNAEDKVYCSYYWVYHTLEVRRVAIYDGCADTMISAVTVPGKPCALYCNELNNKVYCANQGSGTGTVTVIDGATDQILDSIAVGDAPLAFGHNRRQNRVYVANYGSSTLTVLRDSGGGVAETASAEVRTPNVQPTVVCGVLWFGDRGRETGDRAELLDATGRKVMDLHPGANDVRALAPGVYFVREKPQATSPTPQAVRKVVLTR